MWQSVFFVLGVFLGFVGTVFIGGYLVERERLDAEKANLKHNCPKGRFCDDE